MNSTAEARTAAYSLSDVELGRALALFVNAKPELRAKLLLDDWETKFAETMRDHPAPTLSWKQRRVARKIVERNAWVLRELNIRSRGPDEEKEL